MAKNAPNLADYVEVPDRILRFYAKYPDGSLQGEYEVREVGGDTLLIYMARAYRTPDDLCPGMGVASEPYPGRTRFTEGSELMNAETSAWGRALVALGFLAQGEKIASANEVRARTESDSKPSSGAQDTGQGKGSGEAKTPAREPESKPILSTKQLRELRDLFDKAGWDRKTLEWQLLGLDVDVSKGLDYAVQRLTPEQVATFERSLRANIEKQAKS